MMTQQMMELCGVYWPQAHTDPELMAQLAAAAYTNGLFDNIGVPFCMTVEAQSMGAKVELGDQVTEPRVTEYAIGSVKQWRQLRPMDLTQGRAKTVLEALGRIRADYPEAAIMGNITGPISLASSLVDANMFYRELRKNPEDCAAVLELVTQQLLAFGLAQIEAGAEFITISDPSGTGEILGPKLFEQYALPCLNRLCRGLRPHCKGVIVHICGQLRPIYPQLAQLECDGLSVDAVVSLHDIRQTVPGKAIMGNVSTFALAAGKDETIRNLCHACVANGADILAPACGLGTTTTVDSIRVMMDVVLEAMEASEHVEG